MNGMPTRLICGSIRINARGFASRCTGGTEPVFLENYNCVLNCGGLLKQISHGDWCSNGMLNPAAGMVDGRAWFWMARNTGSSERYGVAGDPVGGPGIVGRAEIVFMVSTLLYRFSCAFRACS